MICEADYTLDQLFEEHLYFLLPFYIFNLEGRMDLYEDDPDEMRKLEGMYTDMINRLCEIPESSLSPVARSKGVIISQTERVAKRLTENWKNVHKKAGEIMGGRVVEMEWLNRFDSAVAEGETKKLISLVCRKLRKNKDAAQITDELDEDMPKVKAICDAAAAFAPGYDKELVIKNTDLLQMA